MTWILSLTSMSIGGMIYVLWRPDSLNMFSWFARLGVDKTVADMRDCATPFSGSLPAWVYLSLPQALWLFSGCLAIHSVWRHSRCRQERFWMAVVLVLALSGEFGQFAGVMGGVFDPSDLGLMLIGFFAAQTIAFATSGHAKTGERSS